MDDKVTDALNCAKETIEYVRQYVADQGLSAEDDCDEALEKIEEALSSRQAQEAPKAESVCDGCDTYPEACDRCDHPMPTAPKVACQSAEELAKRVTSKGYDSCGMRIDLYYQDVLALIEPAFAAQRQIGREERQHEVDIAELEADRVKIEWEHDLERYAALEEAARKARAWIDGILCQCDTTVDHVCDRCVLIRSIDKALSALDAQGEK